MALLERRKPAVEDHQTPQLGAVIPAANDVLNYQPPNGASVHVLTELRRWISESLDAMPERAAKPTGKWNFEALLGSRKHRFWHKPPDRTSKQPLGLSGGNSQVPRNPQGKLNEIDIQQRHSCLQRDCHAGTVHFCQDVTWQIRFEV
jgi:hypothetical protein